MNTSTSCWEFYDGSELSGRVVEAYLDAYRFPACQFLTDEFGAEELRCMREEDPAAVEALVHELIESVLRRN